MTIYYRWHPLVGRSFPLTRRVGDGDRAVDHLEVPRGFSRELPAWMVDAAVCATMTEGNPRVGVMALMALRALLDSRDLAAPDAPVTSDPRTLAQEEDSHAQEDPTDTTLRDDGVGARDAGAAGAEG